jgi:hypothetical protein
MSLYPIKLDRLTNGSLISQGIQIEVLVGFVRITITTIPTIDFIYISLLTSLPCFSATNLLCRWLRITRPILYPINVSCHRWILLVVHGLKDSPSSSSLPNMLRLEQNGKQCKILHICKTNNI